MEKKVRKRKLGKPKKVKQQRKTKRVNNGRLTLDQSLAVVETIIQGRKIIKTANHRKAIKKLVRTINKVKKLLA